MSGERTRPYVIHSARECDRLERQAVLAGIGDHLPFIPVPAGGRVLDAGCGSGSMARLLARAHPESEIFGVDLNADYLAHARERAADEGLRNVAFRQGDIFRLPFDDATFDLVWSKYLLQWVTEPQAAIAEFRRVVRPGGVVVAANYDGFAVTNWPEDPALQQMLAETVGRDVDLFIGRKMAPLFKAAGLGDIRVHLEPDRVFTVIGAIDAERRRNWVEQLDAARPAIAARLGAAAPAFIARFLAYQDDPATCSYTTLYIVRGTAP